MSYSDQPLTRWGCFAGAAFFLLLGLPATVGMALGECLGDDAVEACSNKGVEVGLTALVAVAISVLIIWAINVLMRRKHEQGRLPGWGYLFIPAVLLLLGFGFLGWAGLL